MRTHSLLLRRREATHLSTRENPNMHAANPEEPTTFHLGDLQWKRVQSLSRNLVPRPELCAEMSPAIYSRYFLTSHTSSGSFPTGEVTFQVPQASFGSWASEYQDLCL